jgi:hypothetical protein
VGLGLVGRSRGPTYSSVIVSDIAVGAVCVGVGSTRTHTPQTQEPWTPPTLLTHELSRQDTRITIITQTDRQAGRQPGRQAGSQAGRRGGPSPSMHRSLLRRRLLRPRPFQPNWAGAATASLQSSSSPPAPAATPAPASDAAVVASALLAETLERVRAGGTSEGTNLVAYSGGVDSSLVAALLFRAYPLNSFACIGEVMSLSGIGWYVFGGRGKWQHRFDHQPLDSFWPP